ncbi:tobamovirus multiplication protein 1 isoform X2 [Coffea arabica]|uniref:Tobamovirus multiplication protein 1 isoform X2 n=1 Tax=Coffea arabica TaxID=13443 RepID=A0A6P6VWQ2_COFAR|nr:tobamovirus multiplication protein 1-like isoform X2 [Coffea arabica]
MLKFNSLVSGEAKDYYSGRGGGGELLDLFDWWNEIQESEKWQRGLYYTLSASYALVSLVALVQLIRIQLRVPEYGWTTQKVFHLMNFIVTGLRAVLFGFYRNVFTIRTKALELILLELPGLLFFSTYTLLVLFWAEIYYQARSLPVDKLRPTYYIINGLIYLLQVCIWIYARVSQTTTAVQVARLFFSVLSFSAALGFLIYGGRLFIMLRRFPIQSRGRQKKLQEVGYVTCICCACFLIRCVMDALSAFDEDVDVDVLDHPVLNLFYYMLLEMEYPKQQLDTPTRALNGPC